MKMLFDWFIQKVIYMLIISLGFSLINIGYADVYSIKIKMEFVKRPCDIYGDGGINQPIEIQINKGNPMNINDIDGSNFITEIPYNLSCDDSSSNPALKIKFGGTGSKFNNNILSTSDDNLGLRFKVGNDLTNLGTWYNFKYVNKPQLFVIPVVSSTPDKIKEGDFTASGTLNVEYQ